MKGKLTKNGGHYFLFEGNRFISTTDCSEGTPNKLSLKNCQVIERGYDLDELAKDYAKESDKISKKYKVPILGDSNSTSYKAGFQKALEILGDKKFSDEQMRRAYLLGRGDESIVRELGASNKEKMQYSENLNQGFESFLSLQQTEWDVLVEMECVIGCQNLILNGENSVCCGDKKPKISEDGCLILKRIDDE